MTKEEIIKTMLKGNEFDLHFEPSTEHDAAKIQLAESKAMEMYSTSENPLAEYIITLAEYIDKLETRLHNACITIDDMNEIIATLEMIVGID